MKKKILLIDDDLHFREMFAELLKRNDYEVFEISDGRYAINKYNEHKPDIVITDIIMPEKEGIETILDLRRKDPKMKIIAISGGGRVNPMDNLRSARLLGADATFEKPFENVEILAKIKELIA
ncbi:MAG: response regulator [Bacteroidetes bacterium 4572_77]|nr:MAG: response regulator [Bacteroidetes bacterium 4572_77]